MPLVSMTRVHSDDWHELLGLTETFMTEFNDILRRVGGF